MVQFEELQNLWQRNPAPVVVPRALIVDFHRYGRNERTIHIVKLVAVCILLALTAAYARHSAWTLAGLVLIAAGAARLIAADWSSGNEIRRLDFSAPSLEFVRHAIDTLESRKDPFRRHYRVFVVFMVAGINLICAGVLRGSMPRRILWHIGVSLLPLAGYQFGMWIRRKRFDRQCRPLLSRLETMRAALQEATR